MLATTIVIASSAYYVPGVTTTIAGVEHWATEIEVVTVWIAGVDAEVPEAIAPIEWTIEIGCCAECAPLPVEQNITHVQVTTLPVVSIHVVITGHSHQVVEINLIGSLVLFVRQVQLVSHLVC